MIQIFISRRGFEN